MSFTTTSDIIGLVVCPRSRPATPAEVWVELLMPSLVAVHDFLLIDSPHQQLVGTVVEIEVVDPNAEQLGQPAPPSGRITWAKLAILSASDERLRPPDGSVVRFPSPTEVSDLVAEARQISPEYRVPLGVLPVQGSFAPVYGHLQRITGPIATSVLISGAAGSLKSSAGLLLLTGIQHVTTGRAALVIVNSKGSDFLFADFSRQRWAERLGCTPLHERDAAIYTALGFPKPPALENVSALVPIANDPDWCSVRPMNFPRTLGYQLSFESAIRYASTPNDEAEMATSVITRQCIDEVTGPFAHERGLRVLSELVDALEAEFVALANDRTLWRYQFQAKTVGAALRQLRSAQRDLGPILGEIGETVAFPIERLANGGTLIVDVAPLSRRAAQAVIDELIHACWVGKTHGVIPHDVPLILLLDELNRWSTTGPTAARLASIVRDQRHRLFGVVGLAQQLSTLNPQLLANADTLWIGSTRSSELINETYLHLPIHIRNQLHRLKQGYRVIDAWPLTQPLIAEIPYPSWLVNDEGLAVVEAWRARQSANGISSEAVGDNI